MLILSLAVLESPRDIVKLQHTCRRFLSVARDASLWRKQCFERSLFLENMRRRRELSVVPAPVPNIESLQRALANEGALTGNESPYLVARVDIGVSRSMVNERVRVMANWDPGYELENVDYYSEYIQRHGPISVGWLQQPRDLEKPTQQPPESRGMALYHPPGKEEETHVIAPLDDGSVCIWDVSGMSDRKGRIIGRSRPGLLSIEGDGTRSKMVSTGVTECISVDSAQNKLYVAVQSSLIEVDIACLQVVAQEQFPFSISALSAARHPTPLTVGTNLSLHLHDTRVSIRSNSVALDDRIDLVGFEKGDKRSKNFQRLFSPEPSPIYASLFRPGPLSILHMPTSRNEWDGNGDIYVAGRFPSILNYDRRYFPKLRGTIHSGARLCSMTSLPCPFSSLDRELMRRSELSYAQVQAAKVTPGNTLVACGEYNSKGSLELYGLSSRPEISSVSSDAWAGRTHNSTLKNRQTSSSSKLLSVSNHGTRIVYSDGGGSIKWVERDGVSEVRRWNISHGSVEAPRGIFGTAGDSFLHSGSGDIALKILNTNAPGASKMVNADNLVLWTGDKLGLLSFSPKPGFTAESFEENAKSAEEARREREERVYSETMRRALVVQADEVRFMAGLGLGMGRSI